MVVVATTRCGGWKSAGSSGDDDGGRDFLDGGLGVDTLSGGLGDDTYQWSEGSDEFTEGTDTGDGDRLLLTGEFQRDVQGLPVQGSDRMPLRDRRSDSRRTSVGRTGTCNGPCAGACDFAA